MAAVRVRKTPTSGLQKLLDVVQQVGLDQLQAVFACTFTFDSAYFQQCLDALAELHPDGVDHLGLIPIDVVCDHRHYRGHSGAYNVHCWAGSNLFHPKLLMLLLADRVVWLEGSQNLTRSGYVTNRELASFHETTKDRLPAGVDSLVRTLANEGIEAARSIIDVTSRARVEAANRSLTTLDGPLLPGLLAQVRQASDVYLVAPFFDRREQAGPSVESTALKRLADQYPDAKFWVYLPEIATADGNYALQASQQTFARVFGPRAPMRRLALCGVRSDALPLHAKLLAIRHGPRDAKVTLLTGSPNLTEKALLQRGSKANVELARQIRLPWTQFERLLQPINGRFKKIAECQFEPPGTDQPSGWHVLQSAIYHPMRGVLEVSWRQPEFARSTRIEYVGQPLAVSKDGRCPGFAIRSDEYRLETISQADPRRRSWCPIVIPLKSRGALGQLPDREDLPPEWWLAQLGSLPSPTRTGVTAVSRTASGAVPAAERFQLAVRVRDLASRMRYVYDVITDAKVVVEACKAAHLELLRKIFETHDPTQAGGAQEQMWRLWVRLELAQVLERAAQHVVDGDVRRMAREFRRAIDDTPVPASLSEPWRALAGSAR